MWEYNYTDEMYHHGIKGMKWGVRRFQNKDGSLTNAGRKRYDDGPSGKNQNGKPAKQYKIPEKKSNHRYDLEIKYQRKGMSEKEAEQAAARRIKAEKYVAAAAVTTVAAAAAYCAYKNYAVDRTISSNTDFQRIIKLAEDQDVRPGRQYMAYNEKDKIKYKGLLGNTFREAANLENEMNPNGPKQRVYNLGIKAKQDIKVASRKRAQDTFAKLYNENEEFRESYRKVVDQWGKGGAIQQKHGAVANKIINNKDMDKLMKSKGYEIFNIALVDDSPEGKKAASIFYEELKKQGMNAIQDVNDKKYSGYGSKDPIITFDGAYEYTKKLMSDREIVNDMAKANNMILKDLAYKEGAKYGLGYGGTMYALNKASYSGRIKKYRQEHPDTKMTTNEMIKMFKKEDKEKQKRR